MSTNYLSPSNFIVNVKRLPNVEFFTNKFTIPGISGNPISMPTPFSKQFQSPDEISYEQFTLSFNIDEDMNNYLEIHDWITSSGFTEDFNQYRKIKEGEGTTSDISVIITNSHKNPNIKFTFIDCFPVSISDVELDSTQDDVVYPVCNVSFRYDRYKIEKI